jgi:membrane fusion protein, copper/silver efflux system
MKRLLYLAVVLALIAGAYWVGSRRGQQNAAPHESRDARKVLYYVDPMNPAHTSDKPGLAPCGMKMEPVYADGSGSSGPAIGSAAMVPGALNISSEKQQLIGLRVAAVERRSGTRTLRALGKVALDETRVFRVSAAVDGWVRSAGPVVTGNIVQKDEVLATFYNRDFLTAQQTYLYALNTMDRFKDNESAEQLKLTKAQMQAAEENLEFLGMGESQLQEIARTRQIARNIELRSPVAGLVLARNAFTGLRFERGTELFRIAELDHVWVLADVFENEAQDFQPGTIAHVTLLSPKRTFEAKVCRALPQFDSATRTLKVRLEASNPASLLRPDMFVDVELPIAFPPTVIIPAEAVLDSGLRKTVFVDRGNGFFEPRGVETGWRSGDQVQICGGLMPDERIVISGNFLLDSESRMKRAAAGLYGTTARDLVCGMEVEEQTARAAKRTTYHEGATYYFCGDNCKKEFDAQPSRYLQPAEAKGPNPAATPVFPDGSMPKAAQPEAAAPQDSGCKDPVCGMAVDEKEAKAANRCSQYQGKTYSFCSDLCKSKFDKSPSQFLPKPMKKRRGSGTSFSP